MKRVFRIIGIYLIGVMCLVIYFVMRHSSSFNDFLQQAKRSRIDWSFGVYAMTGLIELTLLVIGISVLVITSILLIKSKYQSLNIK